ncbi:MAG: hypothetical protein ACW977_16715 [Candidatus Thorarchaeota archaeon]|jgi:hypothetical protein
MIVRKTLPNRRAHHLWRKRIGRYRANACASLSAISLTCLIGKLVSIGARSILDACLALVDNRCCVLRTS